MRWLGPIAGMLAAALVGTSVVAYTWAADGKDRPFGGPPPQRNDERPFGGPPPSDREIKFKKAGKKCATASGTCDLTKARAVGTACSCPDGDEKGVQGKVE